jgi:Uma2 family endonuclease
MGTSLAQLIAPDTPRQAVTADGSLRDVPERMTLAEFEAFPWREGDHWELIGGVPVMAASPRGEHSIVLSKLIFFLEYTLADADPPYHVLPVHDLRVPESESYVEPDIMVIADDERFRPKSVPYTGTPSLIVEVLSPSTAGADVGQKQRIYAAKGVPEYWIVDPDMASIKVQTLQSGAYEAEQPGEDGFVFSPFLKGAVKLRRKGKSFVVEFAAR